jgi:hypothetical protein
LISGEGYVVDGPARKRQSRHDFRDGFDSRSRVVSGTRLFD